MEKRLWSRCDVVLVCPVLAMSIDLWILDKDTYIDWNLLCLFPPLQAGIVDNDIIIATEATNAVEIAGAPKTPWLD